MKDDDFKEAGGKFTEMVEKYKSPTSSWLNIIESEINVDGRDLTRHILQGHISSRGSGDVGQSITTKNGIVLTHRRLIKRTLKTLFGEIDINRMGYCLRTHPNIFPLDALLNLPLSSFSFGLQRFIARHAATSALSEMLSLVFEVTGMNIGPRQAIKILEDCALDFDDFYTEKMACTNKENPILVLTTDGKGIVMRHDGLREATQNRALESEQKMKTRLSKGEKTNRKRMAQVASIYFIDRFIRTSKDVMDELQRKKANSRRPRPTQKRVWASIEKNTDDIIKAMFDEANKRDPKHKKEWVILVDGNKHQLRLVKSLAKQKNIDVVIILDIIHVIEYLWDAARVFIDEANHAACEAWVQDKLIKIINGEAGKVAGSIRIATSKRNLTKAKKKTARDCARYLGHHKSYTHYEQYLKLGYPIATGVIEGACRYLIKDRMDITGARWSLSGAESILKLRSLVTSNDFDAYWNFHLQSEYNRNYEEKIGNLNKIKGTLAS